MIDLLPWVAIGTVAVIAAARDAIRDRRDLSDLRRHEAEREALRRVS